MGYTTNHMHRNTIGQGYHTFLNDTTIVRSGSRTSGGCTRTCRCHCRFHRGLGRHHGGGGGGVIRMMMMILMIRVGMVIPGWVIISEM